MSLLLPQVFDSTLCNSNPAHKNKKDEWKEQDLKTRCQGTKGEHKVLCQPPAFASSLKPKKLKRAKAQRWRELEARLREHEELENTLDAVLTLFRFIQVGPTQPLGS